MKKLLINTAAVAAILAMASCSTMHLDQTLATSALQTGLQALTLSDQEVISYVHQAVQQMDAKANIAPASNAYTQRLNRLTAGLTDVDGLPLNFKVYITPQINAFACADGSVRVYSGIMDMMSDDELLGIIGHEVGHVAMKHSKNAMKQELMNNALLAGLASTSTAARALTESQLTALASAAMSAKYSRKQENEADDFGYEFLKGAGKNPWGMVSAFEKMLAYEQKAQSSGQSMTADYLANMFADHPSTTDRIKRMSERAIKDGIPRK